MMSIQYTEGLSVHRRIVSIPGEYLEYTGDIMSTLGGGCHEYTEGYHEYTEGYHEYTGGIPRQMWG